MNDLTARINDQCAGIPLGRYCLQVAGKFVFFSDSLTDVLYARTKWGLKTIELGVMPQLHAFDTLTGNEISLKTIVTH